MKTLANKARRAHIIRHLAPVSAVVLAIVVCSFLVGDAYAKIDPANALTAPSWLHDGGQGLLGTDSVGRDIFARIARGARSSILVSFAGAGLGIVIGMPLAFVAAMGRGLWSWLVLRLMDLQLAVPYIILALFIASLVKPGPGLLIVLLGLPSWVYCARVVRSVLLEELPKEYVKAARMMGASNWRIARVYLMPQTLPTLAVVMGNLCASLVLLEATLSFLGMGLQPPEPTLGGMMLEGRQFFASAWWISTFPGFAVLLVVWSLYFAIDAVSVGRSRRGVSGSVG